MTLLLLIKRERPLTDVLSVTQITSLVRYVAFIVMQGIAFIDMQGIE